MMEEGNFNGRQLCMMISDYWRKRGYLGIRCHVEHLPMCAEDRRWLSQEIIRSNIGPKGYPPKDVFGAYLADSKQ